MDVVQIALTKDHMQVVRRMATAAEIGGRSEVRPSGARIGNLGVDQLIGQIGECGLHLWVYEDIEPYVNRRERMNLTPHVGDGGEDLDGLTWDIKTSMMRAGNDPTTYRLLVRPKERHPGFIYILGLVAGDDTDEPTLVMPGWCHEHEIPGHVQFGGPFDGAHVVRSTLLRPMSELKKLVERFRIESMMRG